MFSAMSTAQCSLRIAFPLDVHTDGPNDVGLIGCSKLKLDFIPSFAVKVLEKQIEATSSRLRALAIPEDTSPSPRIDGSSAVSPRPRFSLYSGWVFSEMRSGLV